MTRVLTLLGLASAAAWAQLWTLERVDSLSSCGYVELARAQDGTLWLAYVTPGSNIRVARRDTAWSYEDIDTTQLCPNPPYWLPPLSLALDSGCRPGIAVTDRLAERSGNGWVVESLPMTAERPLLTYDQTGLPAIAFLDNATFGVAVRETSGWRSLPRLGRDTSYLMGDGVDCLAFRGSGAPMFSYWAGYSMGGLIDWGRWEVYVWEGGNWRCIRAGGGVDAGGYAFAILADTLDSIHIGFCERGQWVQNLTGYDNDYLDAPTGCGAAELGPSDRPQAAWLASGGIKHGFKTGYWHIGLIPGTNGARWCDLAIDDDGQPIVAFVASDNSVWLARGVDVVGVADSSVGLTRFDRTATFARNQLLLRGAGPAELLDLSGRCAMRLVPGGNDVRGLEAGVYFLREQPGAVTKVIVTR